MGKYTGTRTNDGPFGGLFRTYRSDVGVTNISLVLHPPHTYLFNMLVIRKASKSVSISSITHLWAYVMLTL